jgi:hypothetical protein
MLKEIPQEMMRVCWVSSSDGIVLRWMRWKSMVAIGMRGWRKRRGLDERGSGKRSACWKARLAA